MDAPAYPAELSKCLIDSDGNQLLGSTLETQPQFSAEANQQSCVSPTCSAGCCVVMASVGGQGGILPDCACARGGRFRGCKRRIWRSSELSTLVLLHSALGNKWSAIAKYLHGRSDNDCKNIFYSALRSKTSQTNRLLRTYAQAVGPNCDDPLARQNAYKAAKAQVAARNASLISRAAALAPRTRQASGRGGGSTSDDDSDIPADAAAAAAQAAAAFPQTDTAAAAAAAAAAPATDGDSPEDMDPLDAGAYVSALQLQQATAAAAAVAAAGGSNNGPPDPSPGTNPNSRALMRRLSAQSGNRDSSMYSGGGGSPSIAPSFPQETGAAAAAAPPPPPPSRSYTQAYRDAQETRGAGSSRQSQPPPPLHQHQQQHQLQTSQQQPPWASAGRGLLPPTGPHPIRHTRQRLLPFGPHPSPLSGGMITVTSHDGSQLAGTLTYGIFTDAGSGALPENFGTLLVGADSSTESMQDATSAPSLRRGSGGGAGAAATAAATATGSVTAAGRKVRARERDASSGVGSTSSFGAVKSEWSGNAAVAAGSPGDTITVLQIPAHSAGAAAPAGTAQCQGQPSQAPQLPQHMAAAAHSSEALDVRGSLGSGTFQTKIKSASPQDGPLAANFTSYQHHHPNYSTLSLSIVPANGSGTIPSPPSSTNTGSQGQALQPPSAPTPPLPRLPMGGAPNMPFGTMPPTMCEELLPTGSTGPIQAAASITRWETPPPTAAGAAAAAASVGGAATKFDMLAPPVAQGSGVLVYPAGGGWELGSLELVPCVSTGSGGGSGTFAVLPSSAAPQMLHQQQHQYHLGLQLQAQLQAQQQQLQEQQLQLQLQLAQLQALQQQHQRLQHLQQHQSPQFQANSPQGQGSPVTSTWISTSCGNPSPSLPASVPPPPPAPPPQQQQHGMRMGSIAVSQLSPVGRMAAEGGALQQQSAPADDALTEMWLSMLE